MLRLHLEEILLTTQTDCDYMERVFSRTDAIGRLKRWRLHLTELGFDFVHCAEIEHPNADALSRLTAIK